MQHAQSTPDQTPRRDETPAPGPVELDPSLYTLVAGGSPRNGWPVSTSTTLATDTAASPRNGWA